VDVQAGAKPERVAARLVRGPLMREWASSALWREIENEGDGRGAMRREQSEARSGEDCWKRGILSAWAKTP